MRNKSKIIIFLSFLYVISACRSKNEGYDNNIIETENNYNDWSIVK